VRRGAADCGEYRQTAGAIAEGLDYVGRTRIDTLLSTREDSKSTANNYNGS
jgi:hypothetical protein